MDKHRDSVKRQTSDKEEQKLLRLAGISLVRYQDRPATDTLEAEDADRVRDEKVRPVDPRIRTETVADDLSGLRKRETFCYGSISSSHHIGTGNGYRKSGEGGRTSLCSRQSPVKLPLNCLRRTKIVPLDVGDLHWKNRCFLPKFFGCGDFLVGATPRSVS